MEQLARSVIAVPPLARDTTGRVCPAENAKLIRFLEAGGIRSLLYGGNAVFYHIALSEFAATLTMLADTASDETSIIPAVGPAYGFARDQISVLSDYNFATAMLLPARDVVDSLGIARAVRRLAEQWGRPLVLYLKFDRWLDPAIIRSLEADGVISWIKYAVVRNDPADDDYLRELIDVFPPARIVSGIGEQPAIVHLGKFGLAGFTSGCVCVAPERSLQMLAAIRAQDWALAESLRRWFVPLEDLRNEISPIRVLHHAVELAGIAETGPLTPMLSELNEEDRARIAEALRTMMA